MEESSRNVVDFLSALQQSQSQLGGLWNALSARGCHPQRPHVTLSGAPFRVHQGDTVRVFKGAIAMGIIVRGSDGKEYDLGIDVLWDVTGWTITTQVWVEGQDGGQTLVSELPERTSAELSECVTQVREAVADLFRLQIAVPGAVDSGTR